jgi:hypothetical protein
MSGWIRRNVWPRWLWWVWAAIVVVLSTLAFWGVPIETVLSQF